MPAYSFGEALANQAQAEKEQPIGLWGQRHVRYLKEYRRNAYTMLLATGRWNTYLVDIDQQAQECMQRHKCSF
ncbi:TnpV protein [Enterocloster asparagiformis]|uniref:TnpV protein n=1 Tax=Enterocloster asparagiformis TaxID=333367 RepID=A0A413FGD5_9FIRM|nr:TnpV protein [Enterocloster asparagiformis]